MTQAQRKVLFVTVWTDRYVIKGEILSLLGRSAVKDNRLSDLVNIDDRPFMPITNATVLTYEGAQVEKIDFIAVKRERIIAIFEHKTNGGERLKVGNALEERIETAMQHLMNPSGRDGNRPANSTGESSEATTAMRH